MKNGAQVVAHLKCTYQVKNGENLNTRFFRVDNQMPMKVSNIMLIIMEIEIRSRQGCHLEPL